MAENPMAATTDNPAGLTGPELRKLERAAFAAKRQQADGVPRAGAAGCQRCLQRGTSCWQHHPLRGVPAARARAASSLGTGGAAAAGAAGAAAAGCSRGPQSTAAAATYSPGR